MIKITIPFRSKNDKGTSFKAIGYIYLNNDFIVRQEVKLLSATISTRKLKSEKIETNTYSKMLKKSSIRKYILGEYEYKKPSENKNIVSKSLNKKELLEISDIVNSNSSGTLLSTLMGLLTYTSATGANKNVKNSPIVIDGGVFDGFRFYNLINNEFNKSKQTKVDLRDINNYSIEQWVNHSKTTRLMFALYNFEKDQLYLSNNRIDHNQLTGKTYNEILSIIALKTKKENISDIIDLYRRDFKKKVMNEAKYKLDFIFNDTDKENTEAAHIYEVHSIKKRESLEEWNLISDVDNCLLLTPSVHKAWDKAQIDITPDGKIKNTGMEPKRFERLFAPANFVVNFQLSDKQKMYLKKRQELR